MFCNKLIVCLESEEANPFTLEERHEMLEGVLDYLVNVFYDKEKKTYVILDMANINEGRNALGLDESDSCIFVTSDKELNPNFTERLAELDYGILFCEKIRFPYRVGFKLHWVVSSTEIRDIHKKAMVPIDLSSTQQQLYPWQ